MDDSLCCLLREAWLWRWAAMACEAEGDLEAASIAWGALAEADATGRYDALYEIYFKQMLRSHSILTDVA